MRTTTWAKGVPTPPPASEKILMGSWATGDRSIHVTGTHVNLVDPTPLISAERSQVSTGDRALDGSEKWEFNFSSTVRLRGVTYSQSEPGTQGIWELETLSGGIWTPQASTVEMGGVDLGVSGIYTNEYKIDTANQANCDGVRFVGSSGNITSGPWRYNVRFFASVSVL